MSRGVKIALGVIAALLVLCCIGGVAVYLIARQALGRAFTGDPAQAAKTGHEIADYTLPTGYAEVYAMNMAGIKAVFIGPQSSSADAMTLMLMEFPASSSLSQEEMEQAMRQAYEQQSQRNYSQMEVVGTQEATIKGQVVTLTISESSVGPSGQTIRQVTGVFPGKNGMVMLMATGDKERWDQAVLNTFLASIR